MYGYCVIVTIIFKLQSIDNPETIMIRYIMEENITILHT